jgi:hypothetical protein
MAPVVAHLDTLVPGVLLALAALSMDGVGPRRPIVVNQVAVKLHMGPVQMHEVSKGFFLEGVIVFGLRGKTELDITDLGARISGKAYGQLNTGYELREGGKGVS